VVNAASVYGIRVGQARAAELASTDDDGTDEHGIIAAIDAIGLAPAEFSSDCQNAARAWLSSLSPMMPLILCVDRWGHWVTVIGWCAGRCLIVDSESVGDLVQPVSPRSLLKRWRATRAQRTEGQPYYGIAVVR
jgi:ABC-type bacteriocin/lantibiotic exporter with double-glycine peptidase domain